MIRFFRSQGFGFRSQKLCYKKVWSAYTVLVQKCRVVSVDFRSSVTSENKQNSPCYPALLGAVVVVIHPRLVVFLWFSNFFFHVKTGAHQHQHFVNTSVSSLKLSVLSEFEKINLYFDHIFMEEKKNIYIYLLKGIIPSNNLYFWASSKYSRNISILWQGGLWIQDDLSSSSGPAQEETWWT